MKASVFFWVMAFGATPGVGMTQNLVENGSFEDYLQCPDDLYQIDRAVGWSAIVGSPDYFNACSDTIVTDVPANGVGYQHAFEGEAYVGCGTYASWGLAREPIQSQLITPMVAGQSYFLSMQVSPGGFGSIQSYTVGLASSGIGIRFSTGELGWSLDLLDNAPVVHFATVLQDTSQWTLLTGYFVADSAYQFVQIGNSLTDAATQSLVIDPGAASEAAYAFVDDVCVSAQPGVCAIADGVAEGTHGRAGLCITQGPGGVSVTWSPTISAAPLQLLVTDAAGKVIVRSDVHQKDRVLIDASLLSPGLFCARLLSANEPSLASKFVFFSP